ncbi:hypothetical protein FISHEDRAFT_52198 [Fistulina hepatica ATCC 64428]|nr:hypothetical protein FISHEDRAFT_52198 [Fistulina hepatica ATCC 64428]
MASLLISSFAPFPTFTLHVNSETPISSVIPLIQNRYPEFPSWAEDSLVLSRPNGAVPPAESPISALQEDGSNLVSLYLTPRLLGGKGGFGSQLRAAGGRMSRQKTSNNDSCRDLNGRRLSTLKEAKVLAEYYESEPDRKKAKAEAEKAKLAELERKLGIDRSSASSSSKDGTPPVLAGKKHRFDDTEFVEQSRELVDGVKNAVSAALLKKRKKAKLATDSSKPVEVTDTAASASAQVAAAVTETTATPLPTASLAAVGA